MNWLLAVLISQYMVSATAGLVGQVRGDVNVKTGQVVAAHTAVETGADGLADLQLNPGSYMRLRADSSAVFDSTALDDIELEVTRGRAIFDFAADPPFPVKVTSGTKTIQLRKAGIYGIAPDSMQVFDGQIDLEKGKVLKKGDSASVDKGEWHLAKLSKEEVRHPYAPDRLRLFVRPKADKDQNIPGPNSMFVSFVQQNFREVHDVEIVTKPEGADYVMTVGAALRSGVHAIGGGSILVEVELKSADGTVVFSNQRDDSEGESADRVSSGDLFLFGDGAAKDLIHYVTNKTGWR